MYSKKRERNKLVLIIISILLFLSCCSATFIKDNKQHIMEIDKGVEQLEISKKNNEDLKKELEKKVLETQINMTINPFVEMKNGDSEAKINIENKRVNRYPQIVEIKLNYTGEIIYKSNLIPVGYQLKNIKLNKFLDKGVYDCTAFFSSYDEKTGQIIGTAGANISINVKG